MWLAWARLIKKTAKLSSTHVPSDNYQNQVLYRVLENTKKNLPVLIDNKIF